MNVFKTQLSAINPKNEDLAAPPLEVTVDAASELTWLPADLLAKVEIAPRHERTFTTLEGNVFTRPVGYAILRSGSLQTIDEVVFAQAGDGVVLGKRTLEGFGVWVDTVNHRFVEQISLMAEAAFDSGIPKKRRRAAAK